MQPELNKMGRSICHYTNKPCVFKRYTSRKGQDPGFRDMNLFIEFIEFSLHLKTHCMISQGAFESSL